MDRAYRKEKKRVGGDHKECPGEFRLEKTRFIFFPYQAGYVSPLSNIYDVLSSVKL